MIFDSMRSEWKNVLEFMFHTPYIIFTNKLYMSSCEAYWSNPTDALVLVPEFRTRYRVRAGPKPSEVYRSSSLTINALSNFDLLRLDNRLAFVPN